MKTDEQKYKELAKIFSKRRNQLHLTLKQVGARAGVDWQAVRRFELCKLKKIRPFIRTVAPALGLEISEEMIPDIDPYSLTKKNKPEFGGQVFRLRLKMGLSQEAFGEIFGMYGSTISQIENGTYNSNRGTRRLAPAGFVEKFERLKMSHRT
ncbi:MAG: hypothetical protein RLY43_1525 [Bacteroidota bacterium]|jgi:transcriptional regulator with XRE-family HTH domain